MQRLVPSVPLPPLALLPPIPHIRVYPDPTTKPLGGPSYRPLTSQPHAKRKRPHENEKQAQTKRNSLPLPPFPPLLSLIETEPLPWPPFPPLLSLIETEHHDTLLSISSLMAVPQLPPLNVSMDAQRMLQKHTDATS